VSNRVKNLGIIFDPTLCFDQLSDQCCCEKQFFFQLRSIAKVKKMLSEKDIERVIYAFITSRLDFLLSGFA